MKKKYETLLKEFGHLPKPNINPTFMDICHMGGDRFEERCSQILRFFLSPKEPHKLKGLLLNSLLEVLNMNPIHNYQNVKVYTEETTEDGKRIDITIWGNNFVIIIENKIFAKLYNPLESYHKYIEETYSSKSDKRYVVLSVNKITNPEESGKIKNNNYKNVTYEEFFESIRNNMGRYLIGCDQTYLTFLLDFMRTIENNYIYINTEMKNFLLKYNNDIKELVKLYNKFNNDIYNQQKEYLSNIGELVAKKTNVHWLSEDYLKFSCDIGKQRKIGVECIFDDNINISNPIGNILIYITAWNMTSFEEYAPKLEEEFGKQHDAEIYIEDKRIKQYFRNTQILDIENIKTKEDIVEILYDYYDKLKKIIN